MRKVKEDLINALNGLWQSERIQKYLADYSRYFPARYSDVKHLGAMVYTPTIKSKRIFT